jgi:hypothetical protein
MMLMMNQNRLARLYYMGNGFRVLSPGDHVLCGRSGQPIALDALKYWSVSRQEAYASAKFSVEAFTGVPLTSGSGDSDGN